LIILREKDEISNFQNLELHALEVNAEYFGISTLQLMENAGCAVAEEIASRWSTDISIAIFCGLGGNGGDGFVIARHLAAKGFRSKIILAGKPKEISNRNALRNGKVLRFLEEKITIQEVHDATLIPNIQAEVVVDALLGIGAKGRLRPPILQLVKRINQMDSFRISVDIPTGIDENMEEKGKTAVKADLTVTFHKTKKRFQHAKSHVGEVIIKKIGLPQEFEKIVGPGDVIRALPPRPFHAHKGDFGRLLIIGGNSTFIGAPALAGLAALRTGVDLAIIGTVEKTAYAISSMSADLITVKLPGAHLAPKHVSILKEEMEKADAFVVGPGLGTHPETKRFVQLFIENVEKTKKPLLLDADGIKIFSEFKRRYKNPLVLTPHTQEFQILTGNRLPKTFDKQIEEVNKFASKMNATIILKGPIDIISNGKKIKKNFTGNPGMTVGGTGDVLSGIVGALLAQSIPIFEAAAAGTFINGFVGDAASRDKGNYMVATDLIERIPQILMKLVGE